MSRVTHCGTIVLILLGTWLGTAAAADHVVPGTQLKLRRTANGGAMTLVLRDVMAIPAPGGSNDLSTAGVTVTLFGVGSGEQAAFAAPPGVGRPGWKVRPSPRVTYTYANSSVPPGSTTLQSAVLRSGAGLRLRARSAGLDLSNGEGAVAVRVQWGSERVCTVFDNDAVRRDQAGIFLGVKADAPFIASCDDAELIAATCTSDGISCSGVCPGDSVCGGNPLVGCSCVSPHQPCGGSAPVCNGECPTGEVCGALSSDPFRSCGCLPASSTPCGDVYPSCDSGDCPAGTSCYADTVFFGSGHEFSVCTCASEPPVDACGGDCPPGWTCVGPRPGLPATCLPPFCGGGSGAPVCDGVCADANADCTAFGGLCFCLETCSGGSPFPACGGTCDTPNTSCISIEGQCLCAG